LLIAGSGQTVLINKVDFGRKRLAAARTQPPAADEPNTHKNWQEVRRPRRTPSEASAHRSRAGLGRCGSRPSGGDIDID